MEDTALVVLGRRRDVLHRLQEQGPVKHQPYGKPPSFALTKEGRVVAKGLS